MISVFSSAQTTLKFIILLFNFFVNLFPCLTTETQHAYNRQNPISFKSFYIFEVPSNSMNVPVFYFTACLNALSRDNCHKVIQLREYYPVLCRS